MIHVDFSDTEPVEIGIYDALITGKNIVDAEKDGQSCKSIRIDVTLQEGPGTGREFSSYMNTTKKNAWKIKELMAAAGQQVSREMDVEPFFENIEGTAVRVKMGVQDYQGQTQSQVEQFLPPAEQGRRARRGE